MPIEFRCNECDNLLRTPDDSIGKMGRCPSCNATMVIPDVNAEDDQADEPPTNNSPIVEHSSPFGSEPATEASQSAEPAEHADQPAPTPAHPPQHDGSQFASSPAHPSEASDQPPRTVPTTPSHPADRPPMPGRPHRGSLVFILGLLGLLLSMFSCCMAWGCTIPVAFSGFVMGAIAAIIGHVDLREMHAGKLDPSGRDLTMTGYVLGIVACCLFALAFAIFAVSIISTIVIGIANGS